MSTNPKMPKSPPQKWVLRLLGRQRYFSCTLRMVDFQLSSIRSYCQLPSLLVYYYEEWDCIRPFKSVLFSILTKQRFTPLPCYYLGLFVWLFFFFLLPSGIFAMSGTWDKETQKDHLFAIRSKLGKTESSKYRSGRCRFFKLVLNAIKVGNLWRKKNYQGAEKKVTGASSIFTRQVCKLPLLFFLQIFVEK